MKILEVQNLCKKYKGVEILKNISFSVEEGETLAIIGPSGSGKSTLLRCINNLEKIDGGNVIINGEKLVKEYRKSKAIYSDKQTLKKINLDTGMVFQDFNLFPHLKVKENITLPLVNVLKKERQEADEIAYELLKKMNLEDKIETYPCNLSGGQKQRVSIARTLAIDPKIICLDEPTSSLDPELIGEVLKVIRKLSEEKRTMVIVTHEIKFASQVADKIIFMDNGIIVEEGTPNEVIQNPKCERTKEFLKRYKEDFKESEEEMEQIDLEKNKIFEFFKQISEIPRKSSNEEAIRDYLVDFANKRNLSCYTDEYFNVIITKNSNVPERKNEYLALQAHTDMICEKIEGSTHDFLKDKISLIKEGDYLRAKDTTLGADNGIGMAIILTILDTDELRVPNLECIFTVQEETTMDGVKNIDVSKIKSKKIISLDNGKEGNMIISSANCMEWISKLEEKYVEVEENMNCYELSYSNFKGGHSGGNIADKKRGNPIKLGMEILNYLEDVYLIEVRGGSRVNVIPRDFKVKFATSKNIEEIVNQRIKEQKEFYGEDVIIEFNKCEKVKNVLSQSISDTLIKFIYSFKNGALMFDDKNNVILSANFAAISQIDGYIKLEYSLRSNDIKLRDKYIEELNRKGKESNVEVIWCQELAGFEPDYNGQLVNKAVKIYKKLYNRKLTKCITQGVLEGGIFKNRIKDLEYICIGPNIFNAHSPKEAVSISSVNRTLEYVKMLVSQK